MTLGNFAYTGIQRSYSFNGFYAGRFLSAVGRSHAPSISCEMVNIKADSDNANPVWIGSSDLTSDIGFQLDPGDMTGWIPINNVNKIYYVMLAASDKLQYMIVK